MKISDEAVEAAAEAAYRLRPATYYLDDAVVSWEQLSESGSGQRRKDRQIAEARAALQAAAPHMLAGLRERDESLDKIAELFEPDEREWTEIMETIGRVIEATGRKAKW